MAKGLYISKALAIATIVLTVSAVCGIVLMVILYQMQIENNPPVRPPSPSTTTPLPSGPPPTLRLPDYLIPESYTVFLQLYHHHTKLPNATEQDFFKGNSTVTFKCVTDTRSIFLHAVFLNITNVVVTHSDTQKKIDVESYTLYDELNFLEIQLKDVPVRNGSHYDLFTEFDGELQADLAGLYSSQYTEKVDGEDVERFLVASQMQPTDARRVFPCFDEPAMKAVFTITIIHNDGTIALSNTAGTPKYVYMEDGTKWIATEFLSTPVMSTYLLAFTVIEYKFGSKAVKTDDTKEMKIWARPEAVNAGHADYASLITGKILSFYEDLFQMKYPLNKLDQIAVPDFSGSGMENWGLIMYRESALLYEEGVSSISNKEWIASVVAHELAHQWFGNLVTMKWWNNLWLNEGFATFLSYIAVNATEPTWHIIDLIILKEIRVAMEFDSLNSSHPLSYPESEVENPYEISELFDSITYSKGAAVLRMLYAYIEEKAFIQGLRTYLTKFQFKNVDNKDLWECFQEGTHKDVAGVMKPWIEQAGYPVITIDTSNGEISQEQFFINRIEDQGLVWQVPIKFVISGSDIQNDLLKEKGPISTPAYEVKDNAWLLANINCTGYYRVNYDEQNWNKLINQLESNYHAIPLISRGQLIDDAFHLARAKYINVTLALTTTKYLINETEYVPWESALNNLHYFMLMFDRSEVYGPMQKYLRKQVAPLYEYFKEYTENATVPSGLAEQYNQINAISVACSSGNPDCTTMARSLFNEWRNGTNRIPPNLKSTIYCHAIATGDEDDWDFAWEKYKSATIATEKDKLRYALSCTKTVWLLNRYLDYTLDPNKIRPMDAVSTISYIANNVVGQALAWDFIRSHWTYIGQEYVIMFDDSLINEVTQRFSTDFELQQLRDFHRQCSEDESCVVRRTLEQVIERTEANNKWVKENQQTVLNWFKSQVL